MHRSPSLLAALLVVLVILAQGTGVAAPREQAIAATSHTFLPLLSKELTTQSGVPAVTLTSEEQEVVRLANAYRAANGCTKPLVVSDKLTTAARRFSGELATMADLPPDHHSPDGSTFTDRIESTGYEALFSAENIAAGYATPAQVMNGWKSSPTHDANLRNCTYTEIGVGYVQASGSVYTHYWTQDFATPQP